jgi:hypothetical protein
MRYTLSRVSATKLILWGNGIASALGPAKSFAQHPSESLRQAVYLYLSKCLPGTNFRRNPECVKQVGKRSTSVPDTIVAGKLLDGGTHMGGSSGTDLPSRGQASLYTDRNDRGQTSVVDGIHSMA